MNVKILARKPYSSHPDDHYLEIVMAEWENQYVTWIDNKHFNGYVCGHYFNTHAEALADFNKRGNQ